MEYSLKCQGEAIRCGLDLRLSLDEPAKACLHCNKCQKTIYPEPKRSDSAGEPGVRKPGGKSIDGYEVVRKLGEGGLGIVYLCLDPKSGENSVIKVLKNDLLDEEKKKLVLEYFLREAYTLMELDDHPNIVKILGCGNFQGQPYLRMEYIEGRSLEEVLGVEKQCKVSLAFSVVLDIADALEYAEKKNIIHRDIKPANIVLMKRNNSRAKLIDFGLSKSLGHYYAPLTQSHTMMGTMHYMPPEQAIDAKHVDRRADIYSLGATFYHMLGGARPFEDRKGLLAITQAIAKHDPAPLETLRPGLAPEICAIARKSMAKNPAERYQSAAELREDLQSFVQKHRRR